MMFSYTFCDRFGDVWKYENFVHMKNLAFYSQASEDIKRYNFFIYT